MKVSDPQSLAALRARADLQAWNERQLNLCRLCLGTDWPKFEPRVRDQLKTAAREFLIAHGWEPANGQ